MASSIRSSDTIPDQDQEAPVIGTAPEAPQGALRWPRIYAADLSQAAVRDLLFLWECRRHQGENESTAAIVDRCQDFLSYRAGIGGADVLTLRTFARAPETVAAMMVDVSPSSAIRSPANGLKGKEVLKALVEMEQVAQRSEVKPLNYPPDYTMRLCEAILASRAGYPDRAAWSDLDALAGELVSAARIARLAEEPYGSKRLTKPVAVPFQPGETHRITLPYSEVCMHMRISNLTTEVKLLPDARCAQILVDGAPYSSPVLRGEAGILCEGGAFYGHVRP